VKTSSAYLYSIDKSVFISKFPKQCVAALKESFAVKEDLHAKKIKWITQEYLEEISNQERALRNDARLNNEFSSVNLFSPKIYKHVHVAQPKIAEKVDELLKNSRESSPFDKDAYCLFSKQDEIPKKVRPRFLDLTNKKSLLESIQYFPLNFLL